MNFSEVWYRFIFQNDTFSECDYRLQFHDECFRNVLNLSLSTWPFSDCDLVSSFGRVRCAPGVPKGSCIVEKWGLLLQLLMLEADLRRSLTSSWPGPWSRRLGIPPSCAGSWPCGSWRPKVQHTQSHEEGEGEKKAMFGEVSILGWPMLSSQKQSMITTQKKTGSQKHYLVTKQIWSQNIESTAIQKKKTTAIRSKKRPRLGNFNFVTKMSYTKSDHWRRV